MILRKRMCWPDYSSEDAVKEYDKAIEFRLLMHRRSLTVRSYTFRGTDGRKRVQIYGTRTDLECAMRLPWLIQIVFLKTTLIR
jgi:hypothetical protein